MEYINKRKVLFVIDTLQIGGAEQSLLSNSTRFQQIHPITCHIYKGELLKSKFVESGVKVYSFNVESKYGFWKAYKQLKRVVEIENPELMVGYITRSEIITRLIGLRYDIPVIGTFITDLYSDNYNKHLSWQAKKLVRLSLLLNKLTSRICISFVANSTAIKNSNAQYLNISPDKIKVINRGRESELILQRRKECINDAPVRFINVSRLYRVKGQKELIIAFKRFLKTFPSATLDIAGEGPMREELNEIIKANDLEKNITLLGSRSDVNKILSDYDCFIFPSFEEGFSGALVEAMFAHLPVLASDIGPNKEAIKHMETGFLFKQQSIDEIEKALIWFIQNRKAACNFSSNAYDYAKQNFELSNIASQFEQYLLGMIKENKS